MKDKNGMEFWIFSFDDPELYRFCSEQTHNTDLYYALYIQECTRDFPPEVRKVLHLQNKTILLIDSYLMPIFYRLGLKGYVIILTEAFCELDEIKVLLKLSFFHTYPEGIINMGEINEDQQECIDLLYMEYCRPYDDLQPFMLRNLAVNVSLLSSIVNYEIQIKAGHLLNYALQFMDLVEQYAFSERKKAFYADKIGITEEMLSRSLQFIYHRTFREILNNRILIEAMRLLVFSDKSITQIVLELNADVSDFNKTFFKYKGMHPKDLRTNYQKIVAYVENEN